MSNGGTPGPEHPSQTRRRRLRYFFYTKHHKSSPSPDAQWCVSQEDEFTVFDEADFHDLSNAKGDLFGVLKRANGSFEVIGTREEQLAEFPVTPPNQAWHNYPLNLLSRHEEVGRKARPPIEVLETMVKERILSHKQKSRLAGGKAI
jgi:hypothetical protein